MTEEQKEKYANFLDKVSEILGLNKPVDILRLCAVTDEYLRPIEKHITELEKENAELKENYRKRGDIIISLERQLRLNIHSDKLTKAKEIIKDYMIIVRGGNITICSVPEENRCINVLKLNEQAEQFLKELNK